VLDVCLKPIGICDLVFETLIGEYLCTVSGLNGPLNPHILTN
jgi:hypothetical protein